MAEAVNEEKTVEENPTEEQNNDTFSSAEQKTEEHGGDTFQIIIAIMIAVVSLVGAAVAWQATRAEPDDADRAGLRATLNAETTRFINNAVLYKRYRAYTTYTLNDELQRQIGEDLAEAGAAERVEQARQRAQALDLATTSQLFFPSRYLNRDGSYNTQRDLGEAWAQAGQKLDLNAQPHFDEADQERLKIIIAVTILIGLAISLLFYTLAEALHPARRWLRFGTALGGTLFLVIGIIAAVSLELLL